VALSLAAWVLAQRDLAEMAVGSMDRAGELETRFGRDRGRLAFLVGLCSSLLWGGALLAGLLEGGLR
jgi:hypothetical protein